jgi:hypothetical protein
MTLFYSYYVLFVYNTISYKRKKFFLSYSKMPNMKNVKKGGSQASDAVVSLVSTDTFDQLNDMFSNKVSLSGGTTNSQRKMAQSIDMNESGGQKMLLFHKMGGKKVAKKAAPKKAAPKKKAPLPKKKALKPKKGGGPEDAPGSCNDDGNLNFTISFPAKTDTALPDASIPSPSTTSLSMSSIPCNQQTLAAQPIDTMTPMYKTTVFPANAEYAGTPFSLGGAKKKQQAKKKTEVKKKTQPKKKN